AQEINRFAARACVVQREEEKRDAATSERRRNRRRRSHLDDDVLIGTDFELERRRRSIGAIARVPVGAADEARVGAGRTASSARRERRGGSVEIEIAGDDAEETCLRRRAREPHVLGKAESTARRQRRTVERRAGDAEGDRRAAE